MYRIVLFCSLIIVTRIQQLTRGERCFVEQNSIRNSAWPHDSITTWQATVAVFPRSLGRSNLYGVVFLWSGSFYVFPMVPVVKHCRELTTR